jgi:predicted nucleic acid-binding protein
MLVLDSGAVTALAARTQHAAALLIALRKTGLWPATVPTPVLIECLTGSARDANTHRLLNTCLIDPQVPVLIARRAATLRSLARAGSAVDALVVAVAEPGGTVLTTDTRDLTKLSAHATAVMVEAV